MLIQKLMPVKNAIERGKKVMASDYAKALLSYQNIDLKWIKFF